MWIFLAYSFATLVLLAGEQVSKKINNEEHKRKLLHLSGGVVALGLPWIVSQKIVGIIALSFVVIMAIQRRYKILTGLYEVQRTTYGEITFPLGVALSAFFLSPEQFIYIMLLVIVSDTFASFLGQKYPAGRMLVFGTQKTLTGSLGFFSSALVVALLLNIDLNSTAIFIVGALTIVETISPLGLDNATIPVAYIAILAL